MNFPHSYIDRELFWTPALKHFFGNFIKWHHLHTLFYKIKIVYIKSERQLTLQIEESSTQLWSALGELTIIVLYKFSSRVRRFELYSWIRG